MNAAAETFKPTYTKEQEDAVYEWAKKTILKDANAMNDKRIRVAGLTGLPQTSPLGEPFETIRAIWNVLWRRKR